MVVILKVIGALGFISSIITACIEPRLALSYIVTGIASCIGCFVIAEFLDTLYQIRDNTEAIKQNTTKETERKTSSVSSTVQSFYRKPKTGWTCKKCGTSNSTTSSFCKECGKDR